MDTIKVVNSIIKSSEIDQVCVCQIDFSKDDSIQTDEIGELLFHRENADYTFIKANNGMETTLREKALEGYVLNSQVVMKDGEKAHLPLMDFLCEVKDSNTKLVTQALKHLNVSKGYLMDSGSSYHFIGSEPISIAEYHDILHKAFLLAPLTDGRWIAHQLINGSSNLRMDEKNGVIPKLVKQIV